MGPHASAPPDPLRGSRLWTRRLVTEPCFLRRSKSTAHPETCPSRPANLLAAPWPACRCRCGIPKGTKQGCLAGSSTMVCMDAGSLLASGREAGPVCNVGTKLMSKKSNPRAVLISYIVIRLVGRDELVACSSTTQTPPSHKPREEAWPLAMPRIPLMRADAAPLASQGSIHSNQVGFSGLPEISISEDIMHLGLPSGEISESDLRRITPPKPSAIQRLCQPACHLFPPSPSPCKPCSLTFALFVTAAFLPADRDRVRWPAMPPSSSIARVGKLTLQLSYLATRCSPPTLARRQCLCLWLHLLGYPIRQRVRGLTASPAKHAASMPTLPLRRYCPFPHAPAKLGLHGTFPSPELSGRTSSRLQRGTCSSAPFPPVHLSCRIGKAACATLMTALFATWLGLVYSRLQSAVHQGT